MHICSESVWNIHTRLAKTFYPCFLLGILFTFSYCAEAQDKSTIPIDDTELYIGAIRMVETLHDNALKSSGSSAAEIDLALQREMNISNADFLALLAESNVDDTTIWKGGKSGHALQGQSRDAEVVIARQRLAKSMSPTGWANFRAFVNGPFRQASFRRQVQLSTQIPTKSR